MSYQPIDSKLKCDFLDCAWGMGLAGRGVCTADGAWWMQCCPEWQDNDEYINGMKEYYGVQQGNEQ